MKMKEELRVELNVKLEEKVKLKVVLGELESRGRGGVEGVHM